jgi:hypothetical protein
VGGGWTSASLTANVLGRTNILVFFSAQGPAKFADLPMGFQLMSHVHHLAGASHAASEYQTYLEKLRAAQLAAKEDRIARLRRQRTFDSMIEGDAGAEEQPAKDAEQEAGQPKDKPAGAPPDSDEGSRKYYA